MKVLDFGLAKAIERAAAMSPGSSQSPTITAPALTIAGVILGTAAYMSPEQANGKEADRSADVWAFGCVLYEMLTGRRAFDGDTVSETIANVLKTRARRGSSCLPRRRTASAVCCVGACRRIRSCGFATSATRVLK